MTTMTLRPGTLRVASGETFESKLVLPCEIEGTPKGAATIYIEVNREAGYSYRQKTVVSLSSKYQQKEFHRSIGLHQMNEVKGLRDEAVKLAQAHWAKFAPNDAQARFSSEAYPLKDGVLTIKAHEQGGGNRLMVTLKELPYGSFLLSGELEVLLGESSDPALVSFRCSQRNSSLRYVPKVAPAKSEPWHFSIPERHNHAVLAHVTPWLRKEFAGLLEELQRQRRAVLARDVERAEEQVVRGRDEVRRYEREAKEARAALEKFDLARSFPEASAKGSATASLGGTSVAEL
jgi:hypothetical protein